MPSISSSTASHRLLVAAALLVAALPCGALDANKASRAELEQLRGLGPVKVERLLQQRQQSPFAGWSDLRRRVAGLGTKTAAALSDEGLTVNGQPFRATTAADSSTP